MAVLVLNSSWIPIDVTDRFSAIIKVLRERAEIVDTETYARYDFESWVETWQDAAIAAKEMVSEDLIRTPNVSFPAPDVIVLNDYDGDGTGRFKHHRKTIKFSRRNIYLRDKNTCAYCGKKKRTQDLNLDHVVPKSQGGRMSWTNIVLSCIECNDKKGNRTPEQAGMRLMRKPRVPNASDLKRPFGERIRRKLRGKKVPKSWRSLLGNMYWDVELEG